MGRRSKHWGDVYIWLESVVKSCKTDKHVDCCNRLITNFESLYEKEIGWLDCIRLTRPLTNHLMNVWSDFVKEKLLEK